MTFSKKIAHWLNQVEPLCKLSAISAKTYMNGVVSRVCLTPMHASHLHGCLPHSTAANVTLNTGAWPRFRALARSWANISIISKYALIVSALYSVPVGQSTEKIRQMGNFLRTKSVDAHITKGMTSYK